jgi:uncharacterized repeat protein (TIGR03803 family)
MRSLSLSAGCVTKALVIITSILTLVECATGQESVLHNFQGSPGDGAYPVAGLVSDSAGNLYGTTEQGGAYTSCTGGCGTVFELVEATGYTETILHNFAGGSDGVSPAAGLVMDSSGNLYGTTKGGGKGYGTVFELIHGVSGYSEIVLYRFDGGAGGAFPVAGLTFDSSNNLWGTTEAGGTGTCSGGCGVVFELDQPAYNAFRAAYSFKGAPMDGASPLTVVAFDSSANLWGTTMAGGVNVENCAGGCGTVFELTKASGYKTENVLYSFAGHPDQDGASPAAGLVFDPAGNLYGTAEAGGTSANCSSGCGTVFELITPSYQEKTLYSFTNGVNDGSAPVAALILDSSGNLYGTASQGGLTGGSCGTTGCGTIFELSQESEIWSESLLLDFDGVDGETPTAALISADDSHAAGSDRRIRVPKGPKGCPSGCFSTTNLGGTFGKGTVFEFVN